MRLSSLLMAGLVLLAAPVRVTASGDEAALLSKGASAYKQFCAHCHGLNMVNPGTSSYDLRRWPTDRRAQFYDSVLNGRGDMPAWGDILLPDEIAAIWHYVATRGGKQPFPEEAADLPEPPAPELDTPGTLRACLARNGGIMSGKRHTGGVGLDYLLSARLAAGLNLDLDIVWFESEAEEETTPAKDTYALLSHGLCDIAPGFALYEPVMHRYGGTRGPLPRWDDRPLHLAQTHQVDLHDIALTTPYVRMEIGLVLADGTEIGPVTRVSDLDGLRIGVEQGTLPGVLTLRQGTARMAEDAVTLNPGPAFLWQMENGTFDAALTSTGAYDFHLRQNPISTLRLHDYRHPLGFNLGVALPADRPALLAALNEQIEALLASDEMAAIAEASGMHFAPPRPPLIQSQITMRDILALH